MQLSRYAFLFEEDGQRLLYFSKLNNFYEVDERLYDLLSNLDRISNEDLESEDIEYLQEKQIIVEDESADNKFYDDLHLSYLLSSFGRSILGLTVLPTISCNLRCPYCFESSKPTGKMSDETIDKLIDFITQHRNLHKYAITWFGGEPLLGLDVIEKILVKLEEVEDLKRVSHSIVTNGTLLDETAIALFKKYPLDSVQITFDGDKASHDAKRIYPNGNGSFDLIVENLKRFVDECPDTSVSIRVNLDNNNRSEYLAIVSMIQQLFDGKKVSVYPAVLRPNGGCSSPQFFSIADTIDFYSKLYGMSNPHNFFPSFSSKGCIATCATGYVIGPRGEIYRCWEQVGHPEFECGNIADDNITNTKLNNDFLLHGHCFDNDECRKCGFLPICSGGCPKNRVESLNDGTDKSRLCSILKDKDGEGLKSYLFQYYSFLKSSNHETHDN